MNKTKPGAKAPGFCFALVLPHVADTLLADVLATVADQITGRCTEDAGRLEFLQNDSVALHVDLQLIPLRNVQRPAQFDGQHDAAQLIHLANDAS